MKDSLTRVISLVTVILLTLSVFSFVVSAADETQYVYKNIYRLYNPNSGEHFYTVDENEKSYLVSLGWNYEGESWRAVVPANSDSDTDLNPVYRLYNGNGGEHHYTTNSYEKDNLVKLGWNYEGIAFYMSDELTPAIYILNVSFTDDSYKPKTDAEYDELLMRISNSEEIEGVTVEQVPVEPVNAVYRLYNPNAFSNNHFFTSNEAEKDYLVSLGWTYEGIAWYGY